MTLCGTEFGVSGTGFSTRATEEFEIKSYEYGVYSGEITPSETNETNELCIPSTTQEEPLEVIDLDEIYKMKQIDTNESHSLHRCIPSAHMHWDSISDLATLGMWADPGCRATAKSHHACASHQVPRQTQQQGGPERHGRIQL